MRSASTACDGTDGVAACLMALAPPSTPPEAAAACSTRGTIKCGSGHAKTLAVDRTTLPDNDSITGTHVDLTGHRLLYLIGFRPIDSILLWHKVPELLPVIRASSSLPARQRCCAAKRRSTCCITGCRSGLPAELGLHLCVQRCQVCAFAVESVTWQGRSQPCKGADPTSSRRRLDVLLGSSKVLGREHLHLPSWPSAASTGSSKRRPRHSRRADCRHRCSLRSSSEPGRLRRPGSCPRAVRKGWGLRRLNLLHGGLRCKAARLQRLQEGLGAELAWLRRLDLLHGGLRG